METGDRSVRETCWWPKVQQTSHRNCWLAICRPSRGGEASSSPSFPCPSLSSFPAVGGRSFIVIIKEQSNEIIDGKR